MFHFRALYALLLLFDMREINSNSIQIQQVESFRYPGHTMIDNGRCEKEINSRFAQAKDAFDGRKELLTKSLEKSTYIMIHVKICRNISVVDATLWV